MSVFYLYNYFITSKSILGGNYRPKGFNDQILPQSLINIHWNTCIFFVFLTQLITRTHSTNVIDSLGQSDIIHVFLRIFKRIATSSQDFIEIIMNSRHLLSLCWFSDIWKFPCVMLDGCKLSSSPRLLLPSYSNGAVSCLQDTLYWRPRGYTHTYAQNCTINPIQHFRPSKQI